MPAPNMIPTIADMMYRRNVNKRMAIKGCALCNSNTTKPIAAQAEPNKSANVPSSHQPSRWPVVIPLRNNKVAKVTRQKDSGLNAAGRVPALRPGMKNNPATAAIMANGTAPIKLNRQPISSTIQPPRIGPTAGPMTMPMPTRPIALPRSCGSNTKKSVPITRGWIMPAQKPWVKRAPTTTA